MNDRAGASQLLPRNVDLEIAEAEIQGSPLTIARQSLGRRGAATCQIVDGYRNGCTIPLRPLSQRFSDLWLRSRYYNRSRRSTCASANIRKKRGQMPPLRSGSARTRSFEGARYSCSDKATCS